VARICRAVDGLPLAIELAAARAGVLSAEEIAGRLADMFRFLALPRPAADPRHQTLGAAIGWSYQLLTEPERRGFRALSVFAGGFGLAEAAGVCCGGDQAAALDLVDVLAGKSLVVAEPAGGSRYRLLETIRQYAADRLAEAGEAAQARGQHAEVFLRLAERERQLPVLVREQDNFRAALDHALAAGDGETGPRLARALGGFWLARGLFQEGRGWLERGRWRATRAKLLARHGQLGAAARLAEEAVALVPATSGAPQRAEFLVAQAEVARLAGALGQAEASLRHALQFYQDRRMVALAERTRSLLAGLTRQPAPH
jgi:predicted ATPase